MSRCDLRLMAICGLLCTGLLHAQPKGRLSEPLLVDLGGDGFTLGSVAEGVLVDLDGDGQAERVAWPERGSNDAFLVIDENKNGLIDIPVELIGGVSGPPNGFAFLGAYDGFASSDHLQSGRNRLPNGYIDAGDEIYARLILWTDANHDGVSEEDELESLSHAGINRIPTGYEAVTRPDHHGNLSRFRASATRMNSRGVEVGREIVVMRLRHERVR